MVTVYAVIFECTLTLTGADALVSVTCAAADARDWEARRSRWAVALAARLCLPLSASPRTFFGMLVDLRSRKTSPTNTAPQFLSPNSQNSCSRCTYKIDRS